jgi:arabinofuranosyltransferase
LPAGYLESCRSGENQIEDPDLHAYYERVRLVISGPLWSIDRLKAIVAWNLGTYDELLARYAERAGLRAVR